MNRQPSREALEFLVDRLPVGIQTCSAQGVITLSNAFHSRMYGYGPGELVGRTVWSLVKDEKQRAELPGYLAYLVAEQPDPTPYFSVDLKRNGREIAVRVDWTYEHDERGEVIGFLCAVSERPQPGSSDARVNEAVWDALVVLQRVEALLARTAAPRVPQAPGPALSTREHEILEELLRGHNPVRIADALGISVHTVRNHMKSIYRRFGVHSREQLSALFLRNAWERKQ